MIWIWKFSNFQSALNAVEFVIWRSSPAVSSQCRSMADNRRLDYFPFSSCEQKEIFTKKVSMQQCAINMIVLSHKKGCEAVQSNHLDQLHRHDVYIGNSSVDCKECTASGTFLFLTWQIEGFCQV